MKSSLKLIIVVSMLSLSVSSHADSESEALARLVLEIELLTPIVDEAERSQTKSNNERFEYDRLRQDLLIIKNAVSDHLKGPWREPRSLKPLNLEEKRDI